MSEKKKKKSTANQLTATDRKSLAKITEGRFELLNQQINTRISEIKKLAKDRVLASRQDDIEKYQAKLDELREDARALEDRGRRLTYEAQANGIKIPGTGYRSGGNPVSVTVSEEVEPLDTDKKVQEEYDEIAKDHQIASYNLRGMKLEILEKIAVAGLESDEAKNFLGQIPDIDTLLPKPEDIKQLQS